MLITLLFKVLRPASRGIHAENDIRIDICQIPVHHMTGRQVHSARKPEFILIGPDDFPVIRIFYLEPSLLDLNIIELGYVAVFGIEYRIVSDSITASSG